MKHASIYITESIAKRSETQAFRRYTEFKQHQGETDMEKIKEDFMTFRNALRTDIISLRTVNRNVKPSIDGGKYEEGCTRLYLNQELTNAEDIRILDNILTVILKNTELYNQYDKNLNNLNLEELKKQFQDTLQQISADERNKVENMNYDNQSSSYDIIPINSFEESKKYFPLCIHKSFSNNNNKPEWCLTYSERNFDNYTKNGLNQIYFCIRKGIKEDDEPIRGEGHPQDEYGNSMICVIVDEEGELAYSTSRWNHELGANDKAYSVVDISHIVGVDFYKTFLPNQNFKMGLEKAMKIFHESGSLEGFDEYKDGEHENENIFRVCVVKKYNFLNVQTGKFLCDTWFDYAETFTFGYAVVISYKEDHFYNFINADGKIISDIWFDEVEYFFEGFSKVNLLDKGYNFIDKNGKLLSNIWFDNAENFINNFACIFFSNKGYNFINTEGKIISDIWFENVNDFENNYAKVYLNDKGWNLINNYGEILGDIYFDKIEDFDDYDGELALVEKFFNNKNETYYNFINTNGQIISKIWFEEIFEEYNDGFLDVLIEDEGWVKLDKDGNLYDEYENFIKNISPQQNDEDIANESLRRKYAKELNEILDLNKRIKKNIRMKHASIYLTEGIAKKSETQAFRRYTEFKQRQGETDMESIKKGFKEFRNSLRTDIISLRSVNNNVKPVIDGGKYEEGCTRLCLNQELTNADDIRKLNNIITVILKDSELYNQYDKNLNDLSLEELKNQFQDTLQQISTDERSKVENMNYGNQSSSYDIVPINSFEDAKKYYPYCIHKSFSNSNNKPEWCLTYGEEHFECYSKNGLNQIYFCVKKGIREDDEPIQGDGNPQDEYGNSMISIIVDEEGELAYSTSRWNHELEGSDQAYSVVDISHIVGVDFYKTFLPNHKFKDALEKAMNRYRETGRFDGFDSAYEIQDGLVKVNLNGKYNFINADGQPISDKWFDKILDFNDGLAPVRLNGKYNFINSNGKLVSDTWFDSAWSFKNGLAKIYLKNKGYNLINTDVQVISDIWFDYLWGFSDGFARVEVNGKYNFINKNIQVISDIWFDDAETFTNSYAKVYIYNMGYNIINTRGELISNEWFKEVHIIDNKIKIVKTENEGMCFLRTNGDLIDVKNMSFIRNVSPKQDGEQITNESLRRKYAKELNEVLNLNKRIKKLYE